MASQSIFAADTPAFAPNGLAMPNVGYSLQSATAVQRAQDLAQALAAMGTPSEGVRTPDPSGNDPLAEALLQRTSGQSLPDFLPSANGAQPRMPESTPWQPSSSGAEAINPYGDGPERDQLEIASNAKNQCVDECYPLLERPLSFPSSDKNKFDFDKRLDECLKRTPPQQDLKQAPAPQPHPHPLPWWMLIPRIAPEVAPELIPFFA